MEGCRLTDLLNRWSEGDREALDELIPLVYAEMKRIAAGYMDRERSLTLETTALVHETYLRLVGLHQPKFAGRRHFYVVAAQVMRRILVDHARRRNAMKRSGDPPPGRAHGKPDDLDILALDGALQRLAETDAEKARIVELRYFAGLSVPEVAEILGTSPATVKRHWAVTKAWLYRSLTAGVAG